MKNSSLLLFAMLLLALNVSAQTTTGGNDVGVISVIEPAQGSLLVQDQSYPVTVRIKNFLNFTFSNQTITVWFKVGDDSVSSTSTYTMAAGDSATVAFANYLDFTNATSGLGEAWTEMASDFIPSNDTLPVSYEVQASGVPDAPVAGSFSVQQVLNGAGENDMTLLVTVVKDETVLMTLSDISGKLLNQYPVALQTGTHLLNIYADRLMQGIYLVTFKGSSNTIAQEVLVK